MPLPSPSKRHKREFLKTVTVYHAHCNHNTVFLVYADPIFDNGVIYTLNLSRMQSINVSIFSASLLCKSTLRLVLFELCMCWQYFVWGPSLSCLSLKHGCWRMQIKHSCLKCTVIYLFIIPVCEKGIDSNFPLILAFCFPCDMKQMLLIHNFNSNKAPTSFCLFSMNDAFI